MINVKIKEQVCVERKGKGEEVKKMWIGEEEKERETNGSRKRKNRKTNYLSQALNHRASLRGRRPQINPVESTDSWVLTSDDMMWGPDMCVFMCVYVVVVVKNLQSNGNRERQSQK